MALVLDGSLNQGAIRVALADSQAIYSVGIHKILALEVDIHVVAQSDSLEPV